MKRYTDFNKAKVDPVVRADARRQAIREDREIFLDGTPDDQRQWVNDIILDWCQAYAQEVSEGRS